jgi:hypothetical protein
VAFGNQQHAKRTVTESLFPRCTDVLADRISEFCDLCGFHLPNSRRLMTPKLCRPSVSTNLDVDLRANWSKFDPGQQNHSVCPALVHDSLQCCTANSEGARAGQRKILI